MYFLPQMLVSLDLSWEQNIPNLFTFGKDLRFLRIISGTGPQILFDFLIVDIKPSEQGNKMC